MTTIIKKFIESLMMTADSEGKRAYQKMMLKEYKEAINILNAAITKYPKDNRLYVNRCYCFLQSENYKFALNDAEHLTRNFPKSPRGFFLKGEIYLRLRKYGMAEACFSSVLKLTTSSEAEGKLFEAQMLQILEKGYEADVGRKALRLANNCEEALKNLAYGLIKKGEDHQRELHFQLSDEEEKFFAKEFEKLEKNQGSSSQSTASKKKLVNRIIHDYSDALMDPSNPLKCTSLWVGMLGNVGNYNITDDLTESRVKELFRKYGTVNSVNVYSERKCVFVNYSKPESAAKAMKELQGRPIGKGLSLIIKYPDSMKKK